MLKLLLHAAQVVVTAFAAHGAITALWGWPNRRPAAAGTRSRHFVVVVPAHNEETVIDAVLGDLRSQTYPGDRTSIHVLADRCTDATATIAADRHVTVWERTDGPDGKGAVLRWFLTQRPLQPDEALVVLDADNRIPADLLERFADELEAGAPALQAYLDVANPGGSALATASALSYWASNRMVQLARANLGWPIDLGGTGMCFTAEALDRAGGFGDSLTEDQEMVARLALADVQPWWLHDVRISDEKPEGVGVAVRQRARWAAGRRHVARRHLGSLLRSAVRRRDGGLLDLAVRLVQPGRMFIALISGLLAVAAAIADDIGLWPWWIWTGIAAVQVLLPVPFLAREGVPGRYLVRYPLVTILAVLWIPVRVLSRLTGRRWYHTPHGS